MVITCGYVNGKLHRERDLHAIVLYDGYKEWWLDITSFRNKYIKTRKVRAQTKIYFWIIQRLYRAKNDSSKRLGEIKWKQMCLQ